MYIILLVLCLFQPLALHAMQLPPRTADPLSACSAVSTSIESCLSAGPTSTESASQAQAVCLCYSAHGGITSWVPNVFDGQILSCANYIKTGYPAEYTAFQTYEGFCSSVGDFIASERSVQMAATSNTATGPITAIFPTGLNYPACLSAEAVILSCAAATTVYQDLQAAASCMCYDNGIYAPNGFDDSIASCVSYVQAAQFSDYWGLDPLVGLCTNVGATSTLAATSAGTTPPTTMPFKTTVTIGTLAKTTLFQTTISVKSGASSLTWKSKSWRFIWALVAAALAI